MHKWSLLFVAICLLQACVKKDGVETAQGAAANPTHTVPASSSNTVSASLVGYNHTDKTIAAFYVDGVWGGNITPESGGGSFVCCVDVPITWREGYAVTIGWEDHEGAVHKRQVAVPRYDSRKVSEFNVHFLRSGEIRVFALNIGLRNQDYPLTGPESELRPGVPIEKVH